jgi:putative ABC transport system permease protein
MKAAIDGLGRDLRYGFRSLRKSPGFSAIVVLTLALGIGANSAIFSLVYAAVLRPLSFTQAQRLVFVSTGKAQTGMSQSGVSGRELEEWKPQLHRIFEEFASVTGNRDTTWTIAGQGEHLSNRDVSDNFFGLLGVRPFAGRSFTAEDTMQGRGDVALLSYDFWQRSFGGNLGALGRPLRKKGGAFASYTVIGILPPDFAFDQTTDVWTPQQPLSGFLMNTRVVRSFRVIGRLRPEIGLRQAQVAMNTVADREAAANAASNRDWGIRVASLQEHFQGNGHLALLLLWAAVGALLLIACANTANLLLARSGARESEIAVRLALGSSRRRLMTQLLIENSLLAAAGGGLGWIAAVWSLRLLRFWGSFLLPVSTLQEVVRLRAGALDPAVVGFTLLASLLAVVAFGLGPAWRSTRLELNYALQGSSGNRTTRRRGISQLLVTAETALVMVLTMSAGLLIHSFVKLTSIDPGFGAANRLTFDVELPQPLGQPFPPAKSLDVRSAF